MKTAQLELHIQYGTNLSAENTHLSQEQIQQWVQTAVTEVLTIYSDAEMLPPFTQVALTLRFCDQTEGQQLNKQYRDKDYATNVLTFEYGIDATGTLSGDIVICFHFYSRHYGDYCRPLDSRPKITGHLPRSRRRIFNCRRLLRYDRWR